MVPFFSHGAELTLELSPQYPQANQEYTIALKPSGINAQLIRWFINGTEDFTSKNKNDIKHTAGDIGTQTIIKASVTLQDGSVVEAFRTIAANRVDLLIDAETLTPPFYKGKTLPSSGSEVKVTALVFTKERSPESSYSYLWKINGSVQNGGAVKGGNVLSFVPSFDTSTLISVNVLNTNGQVIASKSETLPIAEPELLFYEKNPLRGMSFVSMSNPYIFIGDEIQIRAEGYYMNTALAGSNILREWKINGTVVENDPQNPQEISLQKEGTSGGSQVSFHIRNLQQLLQGVQDSITIQY